jgi:hypothetical protein
MDIVERLRDGVNRHYGKDPAGLLNEAAHEIEQRQKTSQFHKDSLLAAEVEIERLRKRVELLEGYLNGALNVVESFVHCATTEARKALEGKE